jgi:hypothetical protein
MSEVLSTAEKIVWLQENEGTEIADGYDGLMAYFQYCCQDVDVTKILDLIEDNVDCEYIETMEQQDETFLLDDYRDDEAIAMNTLCVLAILNSSKIVSAMWDDLMKAGFLSNLPEQYPKDAANMKEKWKEQLRVML